MTEPPLLPGVRHVEEVMGTVVSVHVIDTFRLVTGAIERAMAWLHRVDAVYSTYRPDSAISRLGRGEIGLADCPPDVAEVLAACEALREQTGGAFDARAGGSLDPSGYVKGWAVERAAEILAESGSRRHVVSAGGDARMRGGTAPGRGWRVAIAHPLQPGAVTTIAEITDGGIATSGTAERGGHVLDPTTGQPARDLASVTVTGPDLTRTDAYATAALAMGARAPAWLAGLAGHEAFVVAADGSCWWTPGFPHVAPSPLAGTPPPPLPARRTDGPTARRTDGPTD